MGKHYQENLTNQQKLEGGAALTDEIIDAYGDPGVNRWQDVLVEADATHQHEFVVRLSCGPQGFDPAVPFPKFSACLADWMPSDSAILSE